MKWALEVGCSQNYNSLKENARLWLEGMPDEVDMVVLVYFQEDPPYRCPLPKTQNPNTRGIPLNLRAIHARDVTCQDSLGPATYKGLTWVGRIAKISMETWVRDGDGKAKQEGLAKDLLHEATMEIPVGDLLPPPYHGSIVVNLNRFRRRLPTDIRSQACNRCQTAVYLWNKQKDEKKDQDYEEQRAEDEDDEDEDEDKDKGPASRTRSRTMTGEGQGQG
ncbi:hypothetical protein QBC46DRAFT_391996 [Diplogelasinospora grovesii]|uniref:Uncharacterized protein n=1 Tax=Diplogelasinospora grovesii TaxID=303347 RepID=A0AAN6N2S0_9PEZI|nr:hypothetical protein QBC46DRAFT_391996 [Diplogelasinospora grovesii]